MVLVCLVAERLGHFHVVSMTLVFDCCTSGNRQSVLMTEYYVVTTVEASMANMSSIGFYSALSVRDMNKIR